MNPWERNVLVAEIKKSGLKTVEASQEEIDGRIRKARRKMIFRTVEITVLVIILIVAIDLLYALRSFSSYEIRNTSQRLHS